MSLNGIDISNHQAGLDLAKVSADFVICKATEGTGFVDPYCNGFIQRAKTLEEKQEFTIMPQEKVQEKKKRIFL